MTASGISFELRQSNRARDVRISINYQGCVVVTKPKRVPLVLIERIVQKRKEWILEKLAHVRELRAKQHLTHPGYRESKKEALRLVTARIAYFNVYYGYRIGRVSIRNQRTRWGSCSRRGNLNFNYRIAYLDPQLADYLIVHELCHLRELNHSENFWNLVASRIPNYKHLRRSLRSMIL